MSSDLADELEAIDAIYPESLHQLGDRIYRVTIPEHAEVAVVLSFPLNYPEECCHLIQVVAKGCDENYLERKFGETLKSVYNGQVCVFDLLAELQQFLDDYEQNRPPPPAPEPAPKVVPSPLMVAPTSATSAASDTGSDGKATTIDYTAGWTQLDPIVDRQLTFIAYARECHSVDDARAMIDHLTQDRRIARAAHNITSWRIRADNGVQYQDCDDDGETAAGGRLLHLLTMMDHWNIVVCVLRWFGGIHLGPDRFKHINLAARDAVVKLTGSGRGGGQSSRPGRS